MSRQGFIQGALAPPRIDSRHYHLTAAWNDPSDVTVSTTPPCAPAQRKPFPPQAASIRSIPEQPFCAGGVPDMVARRSILLIGKLRNHARHQDPLQLSLEPLDKSSRMHRFVFKILPVYLRKQQDPLVLASGYQPGRTVTQPRRLGSTSFAVSLRRLACAFGKRYTLVVFSLSTSSSAHRPSMPYRDELSKMRNPRFSLSINIHSHPFSSSRVQNTFNDAMTWSSIDHRA